MTVNNVYKYLGRWIIETILRTDQYREFIKRKRWLIKITKQKFYRLNNLM
jgi:hypothetical protein